MELDVALAVLLDEEEKNQIANYRPYQWQKDLHDGGKKFMRRMGMAGNRTGKTYCASNETSYHASGEYPDWWEGWVLDKKNPVIWTGSLTNKTSKEIVQVALLGEDGQGTGAIPARLIDDIQGRQAGLRDVVDTIVVKRGRGYAKISLKTYEQGWKTWQGKPVDFEWLDEEPDHYKIYTEALTRLTDTNGRMLVTFTPLSGETELVAEFVKGVKENTALIINATWDDAPHLNEEAKALVLAGIPVHERDARTKGIPMLGTGRVFPFAEEDLVISPFKIPDWFPRIAGIDFGIDHPFGYAQIAIDRDKDIWFLVDCFRMEDEGSILHSEAVKRRGKWPVSWPHDGMARGKADGVALHKHYRGHGVNLLGQSAHYMPSPGEKAKLGGQPVEPIVMEFYDRMQTDRLKIFNTCTPWLEEFRSLHRDEKGKIVALRDDVMKASFYAGMMARYARQKFTKVRKPVYARSML